MSLSFKKILKITVILIICGVFLLSLASPVLALSFTPAAGIPGTDFARDKTVTVTPSTLGNFIQSIYTYSLGTVGIISTVVLMWGGALWIVAGGNAERIGNAKSWIGGALTGLVLTFTSYLLLNTINPDLVNLVTIDPPKPEDIESTIGTGACISHSTGGSCEMKTREDCIAVNKNPVGGDCDDAKPGCCLYSQVEYGGKTHWTSCSITQVKGDCTKLSSNNSWQSGKSSCVKDVPFKMLTKSYKCN